MKNELRSVVAVLLCVAIWFGWSKFMVPKQETLPANAQAVQTTSPVPSSPQQASIPPSFASRVPGADVILENDLVKITLDSNGGILKGWELKKFLKNGKESNLPVSLAESEGTILNLSFRNANFDSPEFITFAPTTAGGMQADLRWNSNNITLLKRFRLEPDSYLLQMETEFINDQKQTLSFVPAIDWSKVPVEETPQRGVLFFKSPPDRWHPIYFKDGSLEVVEEKTAGEALMVNGKINWAGAESQYFLGTMIPVGVDSQSMETGRYHLGSGKDMYFTKLLFAPVQVLPGEKWIQKFKIYGGPKSLKYLKEAGYELDKAIGYGWTSVIALPILFLLKIFYKVVHNYGVAIILLTILIKILLNPINRKSMESMKRMQALQPKLKELREKYGNDKERMNAETMQLFKNNKVNPMGGCLPMLLQFPIYIALYKVLWNSVELYHTPFFWFYKDLSAPDPYFITPVLLGITMFIQAKMTPSPSADPMQQKMMMIMPLMFAGFMIFLPMGLVLYILVNTGMTILQQWMYQRGIRFRDLVRGKFPANLAV
ncbi:MAG: membrane protein insertase YidC [Deltaproteobacteria bacterium]|nr:membrane protein insertase YidC [Deltaproteobacteria bacterium]